MALGLLVDGKWQTEWTEHNESGEFKRMPTYFHNQITKDGKTFKAEPNRYHLYVSLGCPWANRTAIIWKLKGLEHAIGLSIVDPVISDRGWKFSDYQGCIPDRLNGAEYLAEIYVKAKSDYTGRVTVPVLWDSKTQTIVNNESQQIIKILNSEFNEFARHPELDFYPADLQTEIDEAIAKIYQPINNGVYRAGFATSQSAYTSAVVELFAALDYWEGVLANQKYVVGDRLTLADWCLFPTLFRFDLAYYGAFKCNLRQLRDYPHLWQYLLHLYRIDGVKEVCNADHVKRLYYMGIPEINPNGIVPLGSPLELIA
ncbi:putative glutathione S-transferase [Synechococcus sp. PCC 7502]|uniref:glutathione S-transferase family protein n=1 Tax=Synechococcus sp. PCC 7502 TaxID=1173263 RepID=UPI00029FEC5D|nr:glutathione S-transferase family protein [Synechococcus sp. PCC 7502]AFY73233.1 putative glutathione S-transferase [Synechococcus sp. PCC 7502]